MYQDSFAPGELATALPGELAASPRWRTSLAAWFGVLVSVAVLVTVAIQYRALDFALVEHMVPRSPGFWLAFAACYLLTPLGEWLIYRRLWGLPFTGVAALLRKFVSNELLMGYLGEAQFYAWARTRLRMRAAPFGAIKDVTILSALTGNIATLLMVAAAWQLVASGKLGVSMRSTFVSLGVVLATSFIILLFRQKLFSLPRKDLVFVTVIHALRIVLGVGLTAVMWHLVLPRVALGLWLVLATLRMLVSRLPLLPNKDLAFAGLAAFLLGQDIEIGALMTMMAVLMLAAHLVVGSVFALADLADIGGSRSPALEVGE